MDEAAIERVLDILLPGSVQHRAACQSEVIKAARIIMALRFSAPKKQLRSDAKKLFAAQRVLAHPTFPFGDPEAREEAAFKLGQFGELLSAIADPEVKKGGRNREAAYQRKHTAAEQAFELLLRWRPSYPPTLTEGGDYFELTAALYEGATGKEAGEVVTACTKVLHDAKEDGYEPDKPNQHLQRLPWGIPF